MLVRPWGVPSLALLAALRMVHFPPVVLAVTHHANIWRKTPTSAEETSTAASSRPRSEAPTVGALRYAALFGPYVGVRRVAPRTTGVVVGIPAEVLPQVLRWVPIGIKPTGERRNIIVEC